MLSHKIELIYLRDKNTFSDPNLIITHPKSELKSIILMIKTAGLVSLGTIGQSLFIPSSTAKILNHMCACVWDIIRMVLGMGWALLAKLTSKATKEKKSLFQHRHYIFERFVFFRILLKLAVFFFFFFSSSFWQKSIDCENIFKILKIAKIIRFFKII